MCCERGDASEKEITPEMIEVGRAVLWESGRLSYPSPSDGLLVEKIYRAIQMGDTNIQQAGAEIKVTPEMIQAGCGALGSYHRDFDLPDEAVRSILLAVFGREVVAFHKDG